MKEVSGIPQEIFGLKQEALALELGGDWSQKVYRFERNEQAAIRRKKNFMNSY